MSDSVASNTFCLFLLANHTSRFLYFWDLQASDVDEFWKIPQFVITSDSLAVRQLKDIQLTGENDTHREDHERPLEKRALKRSTCLVCLGAVWLGCQDECRVARSVCAGLSRGPYRVVQPWPCDLSSVQPQRLTCRRRPCRWTCPRMGHSHLRNSPCPQSPHAHRAVAQVIYSVRMSRWTLTDCSWSGNGRYLLSAARDWKCVVWDLKDGTRLRTITLDGPVWSADFDPADQYHTASNWSLTLTIP